MAWFSSWVLSQACGGLKGKDVHTALGPLIQAARQAKYLVSLDFSLAFDHCCPATTVWLFQRLGLPVGIGQMLLGAWTNQTRYIEYDGCVLQTPEKVRRSLPQGDAWSLYGLIALLTPPTINVQNSYPNTIHKTYVDDRSWASNSCAEALAVERTWQHWTNLLGLRENTMKSQYFHQSAKGRRGFIENGISREKVSDSPCLLGCCKSLRQGIEKLFQRGILRRSGALFACAFTFASFGTSFTFLAFALREMGKG